MFKRLLTRITHQIYCMPVLVLMPHSRCNCRCVMCDIWKANQVKQEISVEDLQKHVTSFRKLGVGEVVFSGGEALMHSNVWKLCQLLKENGMKSTLLTTGLLIEKNAMDIVKHFNSVIISLDGSESVHDRIRNIPGGFEKITKGMVALRKQKPGYKITARTVLQKTNYYDFINTVNAAKQMGVDQISFLAADVTTQAFNHFDPLTLERKNDISLSRSDADELDQILHKSFVDLREEFDSRFIAESPQKMLKIVHYYRALNDDQQHIAPACNAPWVSAVIESDGNVRPCFFHAPYGNMYEEGFETIINSPRAIQFRKRLKVADNPICKKCVCALKLPLIQAS